MLFRSPSQAVVVSQSTVFTVYTTSHLFQSLIHVPTAISSTTEVLALLSNDLNRYLQSTSDELPTSLKQLSKIHTSPEFSNLVTRISESFTSGIIRGIRNSLPSGSNLLSFPDQVIGRILSDEGMVFGSTLAGSFGRGLVHGFYSDDGSSENRVPSLPWWLELVGTDRFQKLIENCVVTFVRTGVEVYLEKTIDINMYDEFFTGLANPNHADKMKDLLVDVCNNAIETIVRTSHLILTRPGLGSESSMDAELTQGSSNVSTNLSFDVQSNRRFVLDMTGKTVFQIVRAFLDFAAQKVFENGKRGAKVVQGEVMESGKEVLRFVSARSAIIFTICLVICLHIFTLSKTLVPA
ncbi:hypothetical protein ZOSMA_33G00500 [Zostera marina]|uniref:Uncharacterized protein n=1 Tax=Zostera marina TaxID=29655 RepID=A0A0K9PA11_ZOSMR|nr:hypothetical protein ZOSMA_33G00500 [Zostera marina]